jgi:hypothetical protein
VSAHAWNRPAASARHTPMSLGGSVRPPLNFSRARTRSGAR